MNALTFKKAFKGLDLEVKWLASPRVFRVSKEGKDIISIQPTEDRKSIKRFAFINVPFDREIVGRIKLGLFTDEAILKYKDLDTNEMVSVEGKKEIYKLYQDSEPMENPEEKIEDAKDFIELIKEEMKKGKVAETAAKKMIERREKVIAKASKQLGLTNKDSDTVEETGGETKQNLNNLEGFKVEQSSSNFYIISNQNSDEDEAYMFYMQHPSDLQKDFIKMHKVHQSMEAMIDHVRRGITDVILAEGKAVRLFMGKHMAQIEKQKQEIKNKEKEFEERYNNTFAFITPSRTEEIKEEPTHALAPAANTTEIVEENDSNEDLDTTPTLEDKEVDRANRVVKIVTGKDVDSSTMTFGDFLNLMDEEEEEQEEVEQVPHTWEAQIKRCKLGLHEYKKTIHKAKKEKLNAMIKEELEKLNREDFDSRPNGTHNYCASSRVRREIIRSGNKEMIEAAEREDERRIERKMYSVARKNAEKNLNAQDKIEF